MSESTGSGSVRAVKDGLNASERKFHDILDIIEDAYYEVDLCGNLVACNRAFCRLLGYEQDEVIGKNNRDMQTPEMSAAVFRSFHAVYRSGVPATGCDWEMLHKDGSTVVVEGSVQLVHDDQGGATGFCGILRDVTLRRRMEQALRESEERYRGIIESIQDAYYEVDLGGHIVLCNSAFCRLLGYPEEEVLNRNNRVVQTEEDAAAVYRTFNRVYRTGIPADGFDWKMIRKDGTLITGEGSVQLVRNLQGEPVGFRGILRDVTARRQFEQALRDSEARFRALTNLSSDWYWEQDAQFRYTRMESRHENAESSQNALLGKRPWETDQALEVEGGWPAYRELLAAHRPFRDLIMYRPPGDGDTYYVSVSGEPMFHEDGSFAGYRGVSRDITGQKLAEGRIQHLATHDSLTGLPNRVMFSHLLETAIAAARRQCRSFGVLFIDLDRFKFINDTLGHHAGDILLQHVATRFRKTLRASDVIARLGGDEFVVLTADLQDAEQAGLVARKILAEAMTPVMLLGRECRVSASIGIAIYPEHGDDEQVLMKNADIAMYAAKEDGKNNYRFFSTDIRAHLLERMSMESALRHALERDELRLHYQAKCCLATGGITGVEALLRWDNPELGSIAPIRFIPLAEETGLIIPIGKWVLRTACAQNVAWQRMGLPPVCMAVNLSVRQFADERLVDDIAAILRETGMAPHLLELEITEGLVIHNPQHALSLLTAIHELGVRLAIDDFGAGYSSLGQLKHFPIDTLKLDRSFISDLINSPQDKAITEAMIMMGKTLSLTVVAEGVETREQEAFLRERECDEMQGYYFSRPVPPEAFAALLRAQVHR